MRNFEVGKEIVTLLSTDTDVVEALGNKIFPLIANVNTTFPFLVYRRNGYQPANTKDYEGEKVTVEIIVATQKYDESVDIIDKVATALLHRETEIIDDIDVVNVWEDFIEETYTQHLYILITLK